MRVGEGEEVRTQGGGVGLVQAGEGKGSWDEEAGGGGGRGRGLVRVKGTAVVARGAESVARRRMFSWVDEGGEGGRGGFTGWVGVAWCEGGRVGQG